MSERQPRILLSLSSFILLTSALNVYTPPEGEKTITFDLTPQFVEQHKFASLVDRPVTVLLEEEKDIFDKLSELVFGSTNVDYQFDPHVKSKSSASQGEGEGVKYHKLGPHLKQSYEIDQINWGFIWTAPMYFGTAKTPLNCAFDLGSDWVVAQTTTCTTCKGYKFNAAASGTQLSATV